MCTAHNTYIVIYYLRMNFNFVYAMHSILIARVTEFILLLLLLRFNNQLLHFLKGKLQKQPSISFRMRYFHFYCSTCWMFRFNILSLFVLPIVIVYFICAIYNIVYFFSLFFDRIHSICILPFISNDFVSSLESRGFYDSKFLVNILVFMQIVVNSRIV